MFGHNDQQSHDGSQPAPDGALDDQSGATPQVNDTAGDYIEDGGPAAGAPAVTHPDDGAASAATDDSATSSTSDAPTLPEPAATDDDGAGTGVADDLSAVANASVPDAPTSAAPANTDALLGIKQQALQQLTPLVGHLDQTPEEKFRTTMMMIQAADNHTLIQDAYEAAKQITDEKVRAQALLDIVNEINYFTHNTDHEEAAAA